jgi:hypothetical protein
MLEHVHYLNGDTSRCPKCFAIGATKIATAVAAALTLGGLFLLAGCAARSAVPVENKESIADAQLRECIADRDALIQLFVLKSTVSINKPIHYNRGYK